MSLWRYVVMKIVSHWRLFLNRFIILLWGLNVIVRKCSRTKVYISWAFQLDERISIAECGEVVLYMSHFWCSWGGLLIIAMIWKFIIELFKFRLFVSRWLLRSYSTPLNIQKIDFCIYSWRLGRLHLRRNFSRLWNPRRLWNSRWLLCDLFWQMRTKSNRCSLLSLRGYNRFLWWCFD